MTKSYRFISSAALLLSLTACPKKPIMKSTESQSDSGVPVVKESAAMPETSDSTSTPTPTIETLVNPTPAVTEMTDAVQRQDSSALTGSANMANMKCNENASSKMMECPLSEIVSKDLTSSLKTVLANSAVETNSKISLTLQPILEINPLDTFMSRKSTSPCTTESAKIFSNTVVSVEKPTEYTKGSKGSKGGGIPTTVSIPIRLITNLRYKINPVTTNLYEENACKLTLSFEWFNTTVEDLKDLNESFVKSHILGEYETLINKNNVEQIVREHLDPYIKQAEQACLARILKCREEASNIQQQQQQQQIKTKGADTGICLNNLQNMGCAIFSAQ